MARIRKADRTAAASSKRILWNIAVYIRLSREDGNDESLSVTNQKKIINEYLERFFEGEYNLMDYYIDDGLTGTDYDRPDFQRMIHDMETGKVNCIICKNLSRMFRNYSDQGYFLEKVFPMNKTRFITVGDPKVDSYLRPETIEGLEVPINGLMNDRFAAKTSHDVRDTFATKRRKGEFIGAFAPYGYQKDPKNKNSLVIDEPAAQVVRDIFKWFLHEGMSKNGIAKRLNANGVLNPAAYKRSIGLRYCNPQIDKNDGYWSAGGIASILKNRMYIGTMVQGRQTVISYKVHDKVAVPEDEWYIVEGTHEPIIDRATFDMAQELQKRDTRTAPNSKRLHLLAGFVRCADCKKAMIRHKTKNSVYYYCRTYREKAKNLCTKHTVKEEVLIEATLITIQKQIELVAAMSETIDAINKAPTPETQTQRLAATVKLRQKELEKTTNIIDSLYGDWKSGDISHEEYRRLKNKYETQQEQLRQVIANIGEECKAAQRGITTENPYLTTFLKYRNIKTLQRSILVELVNIIYIHQGGGIEIVFNFADQHRQILEFIENNKKEWIASGKEAG